MVTISIVGYSTRFFRHLFLSFSSVITSRFVPVPFLNDVLLLFLGYLPSLTAYMTHLFFWHKD